MLRIGNFSKLAKISIKMLRYYDKIGLLKPAMIDNATQYRYYTVEQLETVRLISMYKDVGLYNDTISSVINKKGDERALLLYQKQILAPCKKTHKRSFSTLVPKLKTRGFFTKKYCVYTMRLKPFPS